MPRTGPHLNIAAICERVITESDGAVTLIRVVDRLIHTATGPEPPEVMPPLSVDNLQMVISLKADQARGRYALKLVIEAPDGGRTDVGEQDVHLTAGIQGINLVVGLRLALGQEGVYWIDVLFGGPHGQQDELMTRIPLEVVYQRQRVPAPPTPPSE
jgi:hypothetical protein